MGSLHDKDSRELITVVIPNYNGAEHIGRCLDSLLQGSMVPTVIVVDNASKDGSADIVERGYPDVRLLRLSANTGFCHAVNCGLRLARTRFVMLLNNDAAVDKECVRRLFEALLQNGRAFAVQAKMLSMRDPSVIDDAGDLYCALGWAFARGKGQSADRYGKGGRIFSACAGAAMYRRDAFDRIGYFDERHYCYLEDVDICYRAKLFGYENIYEPRAVAYHWGSASSGAVHNPFKEEMTPGNNAYLLYKNMPPAQFILNAPLIALGAAVKKRYFAQKGLGMSYNKGSARGKRLKERARAADEAAAFGLPAVRDALPEEACLDRDDEALGKVNPLYVGSRIPFSVKRLPAYAGIQMELWANCFRRLLG